MPLQSRFQRLDQNHSVAQACNFFRRDGLRRVGAYSINQSLFDVVCLICFGVLGYGMRRFGYSAGAMIIGFILGPLLERAFDQSMTISDGSFLIFVERPSPWAC